MQAAQERVDQQPEPRDNGIRLTVAAVASRLGVAASTLRTWDRRYGLGPSDHTAGSHRRYTAPDVARLETMRRLTLEGVAPADAARLVTRDDDADVGRDGEVGPEPDDLPELIDPLSLAAAAVEADERRVRRLLLRAVRGSTPLTLWRTLVRPALDMVAVREHSDRPGRDPEEMLRSGMLAVVRAGEVSLDGAERRMSASPLSIYAEESQHVDAHVLAGELATRGVRARVLRPGAGTGDPHGFAATLAGSGVRMVVLVGSPPGSDAVLHELAGTPTHAFVISPTAEHALPGVHRARTLAGAVHEIESLLAGD